MSHDAIRARLAAATPGPWLVRGEHEVESAGGYVIVCGAWNEYGCGMTENSTFIANAPADITALLADVDRLTAALRYIDDNVQASGRFLLMEPHPTLDRGDQDPGQRAVIAARAALDRK